jgi:hypothetical protein
MEGLANGKHNKMCSITTISMKGNKWNIKCIEDFSLEANIWDLKA